MSAFLYWQKKCRQKLEDLESVSVACTWATVQVSAKEYPCVGRQQQNHVARTPKTLPPTPSPHTQNSSLPTPAAPTTVLPTSPPRHPNAPLPKRRHTLRARDGRHHTAAPLGATDAPAHRRAPSTSTAAGRHRRPSPPPASECCRHCSGSPVRCAFKCITSPISSSTSFPSPHPHSPSC